MDGENHEAVMNNELVSMDGENPDLVMNNELVSMDGENPDSVMNNELMPMDRENLEAVTNNELVSMDETQAINSEMQLDILEPQPNHHYIQMPENNADQQQPPTKRRKKKSIVWEHFTIEPAGAGCRRAYCKRCKQSFAYSTGPKVAGTSHLMRHIRKGTCPIVLRNQDKNQMSPFSEPPKMSTFSGQQPKQRRYRTPSVPYVAFDADRCRHEIAKMIIMHDYPLHIVEHPAFVSFVHNLQPRFDMVSFHTVQGDCVETYLNEKQKILKVIEGMPGRVCLTMDLWSSSHTIGYMFITGQFIDNDWKMHKKLLNVIMEPYPDSDTAFSHSVAACLSDWGMDGKLFSVTINQQLSDTAVDNLRALLTVKNPMLLDGQFLLGNCLARSLSGIVHDALASMRDIVKNVRDSVKYVRTSESREEKFMELKQQLQVPGSKSLAVDDQNQWNTTYEMLLAASESKEVFSCLDTIDPDYKDAPSEQDWKHVETLCTFLKPLFDTANLLTTSSTPTTNTFFHEAWKIQLELARASASEDPLVSSLTKSMQENFDKYWKSVCFVLAFAVVMDPRFKMKLVEFSFSKIYGEEADSYVKTVDDGIHELFLEYIGLSLPINPSYAEEVNGGSVKIEEDPQGIGSGSLGLTDFDMYIMETTSQLAKSELDQYLEESLLPRVHEFDVIGWWKLNRRKYPNLSKMACDILMIPVCTVPGSSVFDTVRKEMDSYRCTLRPETVEAVLCAKDWLQTENVEAPFPVVKMEVHI